MTTSRMMTEAQNGASFLRRITTSGARVSFAAAAFLACSAGVATAQYNNGGNDAFLPSAVRSASTVPSNGDVNPYGVAFIQNTFLTGKGTLQHGDILVSNFNNKNNLQGTGTTIVDIPASGAKPTVFFQGTAPLGLSTGLGTLQYGYVLVANLPTSDGTSATAQPGSILVINNKGKLIQEFKSSAIDGPWDMTVIDKGDLATVYVANALNGTVSRIDFLVSENGGLQKVGQHTIGSGYMHQGDPAALFDAPTGLVYDKKTDLLYVASTLDNLVFAIPQASTRDGSGGPGYIVYDDPTHLHGALAMTEAPNGHLLVTNNDVINSDPNQPSEIVEFTKDGNFLKEIPVDPAQGGSFGLAVQVNDDGTATLAAVDDNTATLTVWTLTR
ncbi:MAG: hypothetical protein WBE76_16340 [Terracidiphilus sp.]